MLTIHEVHEMHVCEHDWQPIQGWYARYRCGRCRVIGYKPGAVRPQNARCMEITPYRCEVRRHGERCAEPAVHAWRGKKFRCAAHCGGGRTAKARQTLVAEVSTASQEVSTAHQEVLSVRQQVLTPGRDMLTAPQEVLAARQEVLTRRQQVSSRSQQALTAHQEVLSASQQVLTAHQAVLSASQEVLTPRQEVPSASHEVSCARHDVATQGDR